ncbi:MAG: hypothetical protein DRJ63_02450 [Thermoprotei archaeon]|nr:MAG: hypothetical protein DRJ63_02450 [Thermoprotei archaeon]
MSICSGGVYVNEYLWVDVLTPKQARIAVEIYRALSRSYPFLITARKYDYTLKVLERFNVPYIALGGHGGKSLEGKLLASAGRTLDLAKYIIEREYKIKCLISYPSPEAVRVAFGLGIPIIVLTDTPHAYHVSLLTLPCANFIVIPKCIDPEKLAFAVSDLSKVRTFDGVFEKIWIREIPPKINEIKEIGLKAGEYLVFRMEEAKAAYYSWKILSPVLRVATMLRGIFDEENFVFMPRYSDQEKLIRETFPRARVLEKAVDSLVLSYYALAVITGGGTLAHEAALVGTPSITLFPRHYEVEEYLQRRGFPLRHFIQLDRETLNEVRHFVEKQTREREKYLSLLRELEDPLPLIVKLIRSLER